MSGDEILEALKGQIGKDEYNKYVSKIKYDTDNSSENIFYFIVDNIFIANWAKRKYKDKMIEIIKRSKNLNPTIHFITKAEMPQREQNKKFYNFKSDKTHAIKNYTFENFIVGKCNRLAFSAAKKMVDTNPPMWNPLFIHGNTGLGKTHLLNAINHEAYKKNPNVNIVFINIENMFNEYTKRLQNKTMDQYRERYRKCEYLIIDDIQFLSKTDKFQEEFFNTFNEVIANGGKIIIASDKEPRLLEKVEDRLSSRFEGGLRVQIESLELNLKIRIIKQKCQEIDINITDELIELIAVKMPDKDIRSIEGVVNSLHGLSSMLGTKITKELILERINTENKDSKEIDINGIINEVAKWLNLKPTEIKTKTRSKGKISKARKVAAYIAREEISIPLNIIASELNLKDHSAVSKQIKIIKEELKKDSMLKNEISELISKLKLR